MQAHALSVLQEKHYKMVAPTSMAVSLLSLLIIAWITIVNFAILSMALH